MLFAMLLNPYSLQGHKQDKEILALKKVAEFIQPSEAARFFALLLSDDSFVIADRRFIVESESERISILIAL